MFCDFDNVRGGDFVGVRSESVSDQVLVSVSVGGRDFESVGCEEIESEAVGDRVTVIVSVSVLESVGG